MEFTDDMYVMAVCIFILFSMCIWSILKMNKRENAEMERDNDIRSYFDKLTNSGINIDIKDETTDGFVCIDKSHKRLYVINTQNSKNITDRSVSFKDIMTCELNIDGTTTYKKSATRTVGGALVGGLISGGVGAIVGGLSGGSSEKRTVRKIDIKLVIRDIDNPYIMINFLNSETEIDESWDIVKESMKEANLWKDRISAIIDMEDNNK